MFFQKKTTGRGKRVAWLHQVTLIIGLLFAPVACRPMSLRHRTATEPRWLAPCGDRIDAPRAGALGTTAADSAVIVQYETLWRKAEEARERTTRLKTHLVSTSCTLFCFFQRCTQTYTRSTTGQQQLTHSMHELKTVIANIATSTCKMEIDK